MPVVWYSIKCLICCVLVVDLNISISLQSHHSVRKNTLINPFTDDSAKSKIDKRSKITN